MTWGAAIGVSQSLALLKLMSDHLNPPSLLALWTSLCITTNRPWWSHPQRKDSRIFVFADVPVRSCFDLSLDKLHACSKSIPLFSPTALDQAMQGRYAIRTSATATFPREKVTRQKSKIFFPTNAK